VSSLAILGHNLGQIMIQGGFIALLALTPTLIMTHTFTNSSSVGSSKTLLGI